TTRPKFPTELVARIANGILIVLGVFALAGAFVLTEVEVGQVGVRYNNALGLQKEDLQPGYQLELVGMQRIWRLPAHFLVLDFAEQDVLSIRTKDNNSVTVEVAVPYRIKHGEAWRIMDAGNHLPDG